MALTEGVDRAMFIGDSGATPNAGDIVGLQGAGITETTLSQANKIKGPETLAAFLAMIDGISRQHASATSTWFRAVGAYRLWENTIINATTATNNQTLAAFLRLAGLSWAARGSIETRPPTATLPRSSAGAWGSMARASRRSGTRAF